MLLRLLIVILPFAMVFYLLLARDSSTSATLSSQPTAQPTTQTSIPAGIGTAVPNEGNAHVAEGSSILYKTYPPSSGSHYPSTAPYGFSEIEVPEGYFVHSMEHGAVVLYYRPDVSNEVKQQLRDLFNKLPAGQFGVQLIVTPYSKGMTTPLAIAAWDRLLLMKEYNFDEIQAFYQSWVNKGPEGGP